MSRWGFVLLSAVVAVGVLGGAASAAASGPTTYTMPGTYTYDVPSGVDQLVVTLVGGGGGGGGGGGFGSTSGGDYSIAGLGSGGGGGSGADLTTTFPVDSGGTCTITVPAGGAGGTASPANGTVNGTAGVVGGQTTMQCGSTSAAAAGGCPGGGGGFFVDDPMGGSGGCAGDPDGNSGSAGSDYYGSCPTPVIGGGSGGAGPDLGGAGAGGAGGQASDSVDGTTGTCHGSGLIGEVGTAGGAGAVSIDTSPHLITAPTISGGAIQGQTLTESHGSWTNSPASYTYQWEDCNSSGDSCDAIPLATSQSYALTSADVGHTIVVQETASNSGGTSATPATSAPTAVVLPPPPLSTAAPSISGSLIQGQMLAESHGTWVNSPTGYTYQWEDCDDSGNNCTSILGATSQTYMLTSADVNHTIRVEETASNAGGPGEPATSAPTAVVQPPPSPPGPTAGQIKAALLAALGVSGKHARVGQVLARGGYTTSFPAPTAGKLTIHWYAKVRGKRILVARVTIRFSSAHRSSVKIALTRKGRKLLREHMTLKLTAIGAFASAGGSTITASRTIKLKR